MTYEPQENKEQYKQYTEKSREVFSDNTGVRKYLVFGSLMVFIGLVTVIITTISSIWLNRVSVEKIFAQTTLQTQQEVTSRKVVEEKNNHFITVDSLELAQNSSNIQTIAARFDTIFISGPVFTFVDEIVGVQWQDKAVFDEWLTENPDYFKGKRVYLTLEDKNINILENITPTIFGKVPFFQKISKEGVSVLVSQVDAWSTNFNGVRLQVDFDNIDGLASSNYSSFITGVKANTLKEGKKLFISREIDNWYDLLLFESTVADVIIGQTYHPYDGLGAVRNEQNLALINSLTPNTFLLEFNSGAITKGTDENGFTSFIADNTAYAVYEKTLNNQIKTDPTTGQWTVKVEGEGYETFMFDTVTYVNQTVIFSDLYSKFTRGIQHITLGEQDSYSVFKDKTDVALGRIYPLDAAVKTGAGGVYEYTSDSAIGSRKLTTSSGFITEFKIEKLAKSTELKRLGWDEKKINISFDDGPDPEFTPIILSILREKNVKATFFLIGEKARQYPYLVRQILREGHEIGNHTFTHPSKITTLSDETIKNEILSTELAIAEIVNVKTKYFRTPYSVVNTFFAKEESRIAKIATDMGYFVVAKDLDSLDWTGEDAKSILSHFTPEAIKSSSQILLHDGGGNRSETSIALPGIIDTVRANGKEFATVDTLIGHQMADVKPTVKNNQTELYETLNFSVYNLLFYLSTAIMVLIIIRYMIIIIGLFIHRFFPRSKASSSYYGLISVIIPAYNEEKVVSKTIASILDSDYKNLEIIFVNDGSKDRTLELVQNQYNNHKKVTILNKPNGGKANALNYGIQFAKGEIVICLDADTVFLPSTIDKLVAPFSNRRIGGVAGTVLPGNFKGFLTNAQKIEYITSQYNEKLAFSSLGMLNVVPGAIGAWRKGVLTNIGGYHTDTLAEDTDLTLRVQKLGWKVVYEPSAISYTEVPESLTQLTKQRFRWLYGTLQALWKNRTMVLNTRYGLMGMYLLPVSAFNFFFILLFPIINTATIVLATQSIYARVNGTWNLISPEQKIQMYYFILMLIIYFVVETTMTLFAYVRSKKSMKETVTMIFYMPFQILVYRLILVLMTLKAILYMCTGSKVGWGFLKRKGSMKIIQDSSPVL
jgi:cellulose synthase/poly-beta-1,6-N-acetylglucosamine synthase-like glycosyltransferase/peptidoglycan/xylan/chitin deacetylase (PgdA/CDA1 family)